MYPTSPVQITSDAYRVHGTYTDVEMPLHITSEHITITEQINSIVTSE